MVSLFLVLFSVSQFLFAMLFPSLLCSLLMSLGNHYYYNLIKHLLPNTSLTPKLAHFTDENTEAQRQKMVMGEFKLRHQEPQTPYLTGHS